MTFGDMTYDVPYHPLKFVTWIQRHSVYMYICIRTHIYIYVYIHTHTHIYIHTHTHTHTRTHIYIYTCIYHWKGLVFMVILLLTITVWEFKVCLPEHLHELNIKQKWSTVTKFLYLFKVNSLCSVIWRHFYRVTSKLLM